MVGNLGFPSELRISDMELMRDPNLKLIMNTKVPCGHIISKTYDEVSQHYIIKVRVIE